MYFDAKVTSKTKELLNLLISLNLVRRFYRTSLTSYRIFPSYNRHRKNCRSTKTYTKVRGRIRLSLRTLRIISINTPSTYYVLETSAGLMTHDTAISLGIGGLLLMIVY